MHANLVHYQPADVAAIDAIERDVRDAVRAIVDRLQRAVGAAQVLRTFGECVGVLVELDLAGVQQALRGAAVALNQRLLECGRRYTSIAAGWTRARRYVALLSFGNRPASLSRLIHSSRPFGE